MIVDSKLVLSIRKILIDNYPNKMFVKNSSCTISMKDVSKKEKENVVKYLGVNTTKFGSIAYNLATNGPYKTAINIIKHHYNIDSLYIRFGNTIVSEEKYMKGIH